MVAITISQQESKMVQVVVPKILAVDFNKRVALALSLKGTPAPRKMSGEFRSVMKSCRSFEALKLLRLFPVYQRFISQLCTTIFLVYQVMKPGGVRIERPRSIACKCV